MSTAQQAKTDALVLFLERQLPLIKSRTLNAYYFALRYQREPAEPYLPLLYEEARQDYRLARLLQRISTTVEQTNLSPTQHHSMK